MVWKNIIIIIIYNRNELFKLELYIHVRDNSSMIIG